MSISEPDWVFPGYDKIANALAAIYQAHPHTDDDGTLSHRITMGAPCLNAVIEGLRILGRHPDLATRATCQCQFRDLNLPGVG